MRDFSKEPRASVSLLSQIFERSFKNIPTCTYVDICLAPNVAVYYVLKRLLLLRVAIAALQR